MAPVDPDNTKRYWVDYTVSQTQHTVMARAAASMDDSDAGGLLAAFFAAHDDFIYSTHIDGFRVAAPDTNVSLPAVWPGLTTYGDGDGPKHTGAWYYDYVGRGDTGKRVRIALFGAKLVQSGNDYRISSGEQPFVADVLAVLTSDVAFFLDIVLANPIWHQYANCGVNAYWRNKLR